MILQNQSSDIYLLSWQKLNIEKENEEKWITEKRKKTNSKKKRISC